MNILNVSLSKRISLLENLLKSFLKIFFVLISLSLFFSFAKKQDEKQNQKNKVVIEMKGLVCSFCAAKVRRGLKKLSFIENKDKKSIIVDIENQIAFFIKKEGKKIDFKKLKKIVNKAGYEILKINFNTEAELEKKYLFVKDSKQKIYFSKDFKLEKLQQNSQKLFFLQMNEVGEIISIKK